MSRFIIGFILGLATVALGENFPTCVESGNCLRADRQAIIRAASTPTGRAIAIQADEHGYVICSEERP